MDELKPCPFCGGKGKISFKDYAFKGWKYHGETKQKYRVQVICNKCRSRGKPIITDWLIDPHPYFSKWWDEKSRNEKQTEMFEPYVTSAIKAWNRRASNESEGI